MQVHRTTAFRWRHRFLALPREVKATKLTGVAEADETYVRRSYKGQRRKLLAEQLRKPRRRGGGAAKAGLPTEQVPVPVLRNRDGQTTDHVLQAANQRRVIEMLQAALADDAVLCTDGSSRLAWAARDLGIERHAVNLSQGERSRGAWHIQNVNAYHSRFKLWMHRFKGVATSYLPNYLGWFRAWERNAKSAPKTRSMVVDTAFEALVLSKRGIVETVIGQLQSICHIDHTRHPSPDNFVTNLLAGLLSYAFKPTKPAVCYRDVKNMILIPN